MNHSHLNSETAHEMANSFKNAIRQQVECGHSRSTKATIMEMAINLSGFRQMLASPDRLHQALEKSEQASQHPYRLPEDLHLRNRWEYSTLANIPIVKITPVDVSAGKLVYLCGGAYFQQPSKRHWEFLDRLASINRQQVLIPLLKTAPVANVEDAFKALKAMYDELYDQLPTSTINLAGDSSGGGLAAAFCEELGRQDLPQPGHLILISPWLDIDLRNPLIAKYADKDVTLDVTGLRTVGRLWAGPVSHDSYKVSPINGPVSSLRNVLLFVGTREIMLPDTMAFAEKLKAAGVRTECKISREMYHTYPLYPTEESDQALQLIHEFCQS